MPASSDPPPLEGLRVLDLSRVLAGPYCAMMLGDLGADVVKVERRGAGDDTRGWGPPWAGEGDHRVAAYYLCANRNKRGMPADLDDPDDLDRVRELARTADVLIDNFRPGTLARWGLDRDTLAAVNPGLVSCSITGYRPDSRAGDRPGYDFSLQAESGWMSITGEAGGEPSKVGVAIVDVLTGQHAATAILAALHERARSGKGQSITVSLYDSALAGLVNVAQAALVTGDPPGRYGNAHPHIVPYRAFHTEDGSIVVAVGNDDQWLRFCRAIGRVDLADEPRYAENAGRVTHRATLEPLLDAHFSARSAQHWLEALEAAGVPCGPVRNVREALADPVALPRTAWRMEGSYGAVETVPPPATLDRTPARLRRPAPDPGQREVDRIAWLAER